MQPQSALRQGGSLRLPMGLHEWLGIAFGHADVRADGGLPRPALGCHLAIGGSNPQNLGGWVTIVWVMGCILEAAGCAPGGVQRGWHCPVFLLRQQACLPSSICSSFTGPTQGLSRALQQHT
eukprot:126297-Pelagomonas_calceolata.AAC.6